MKTPPQATLDATLQTPHFPRISLSLRTLEKTSPTSPTFSGARLTDARNSTTPPIAHDLSQSNLEHADGFTHPPSWKLGAILDHKTTSVSHKYITS